MVERRGAGRRGVDDVTVVTYLGMIITCHTFSKSANDNLDQRVYNTYIVS